MLPHLITTDHWWPAKAHEKARRAGATGPADLAIHMVQPQLLAVLAPHLHRRGEVTNDVSTWAYVDAGRWMAMCPFCPSAQVVHPDDPRFLCGGSDGCVNHTVGGAYVRIVFPPARTRKAIETQLVKRPNLQTRNWLPPAVAERFGSYSETVADLRLENAAHGIR